MRAFLIHTCTLCKNKSHSYTLYLKGRVFFLAQHVVLFETAANFFFWNWLLREGEVGSLDKVLKKSCFSFSPADTEWEQKSKWDSKEGELANKKVCLMPYCTIQFFRGTRRLLWRHFRGFFFPLDRAKKIPSGTIQLLVFRSIKGPRIKRAAKKSSQLRFLSVRWK